MRFLRVMFWITILAIVAIFSMRNWDTYVAVRLLGDLELLFRLPVLIVACLLAGMLPWFVLHRATRWSLTRKLGRVEATLAQSLPVAAPPQPPARSSPPPQPTAAPIAVPPGVA
jgi:lipopolysaccharide assembly protein A